MSTLSKQQLGVENQTNFPNNTTGFISPALLREFNTDMIDSTVNQTVYTADSTSVDSRLDSLESFSSSLAIDYINQTELNAATASLSASLTTTINQKLNTSSFNSYTSSTNGRLDTIEANYASVNTVNTFGQDQIIIGSLEVQESLIVDFSASFGTHVSMSGLDNYGDTRLGANASSINTVIGRTYLPGTLWINNVSWSFYSASIYSANEFIGNNPNLSFNQFSQSVDLRLDSLELFSSSLADTYATDAELAGVSSSIMSTLNTFSSSQYKTDSASFDTRINTNSSSFNTFSSSYTTESSSFQSQITTNSASFNSFSSSAYKTDSSSFDSRLDIVEATASLYVPFSTSVDSRLDVEEFKSTTFATTGSNVFIGNQTITGSLTLSGSTTFIGNQTITGSVILSSSADVELTVIGKTVTSASVSGIVGDISVISNTASIDMSRGNFFTLNIPTGSITYVTATNIQPGQTVAVKLSQAADSSGSVTFNPSQFKFWSGSAQYNTGSQVTGSTDIFTFVTFDTSSLWTTIVKNLV
jgi:hypothetical protein